MSVFPRSFGLLLPIALSVVALACEPDPDQVITVDSFADTIDAQPGDGTCADTDGDCTLRAAVMEANAEPGIGQIRVPAGTYPLTRTGAAENAAATGDLDLTDSTYIDAIGGEVTIDAAGLGDRVIDIHGGQWHRLTNIRLINGDVVGRGGGLRSLTGVLFAQIEVTDNTASVSAGGVAPLGGIVVLDRSAVNTNSAPVGGGADSTGVFLSVNSTFSGNTGGAIKTSTGYTRLWFTTVTDNTGGGLRGQVARVHLHASVIGEQAGGADCLGTPSSAGNNVDSDGSCSLSAPGDQSNADVSFGPLESTGADGFTAHRPTSPDLINQVPVGTQGCGTDHPEDQWGQVRAAGPACEIGAIESLVLLPTAFCRFDDIAHRVIEHEGDQLVAGEFVQVTDDDGQNAISREGLARCRADGTVDPSFDPGLGGEVHALLIDGNHLYVGGSFDTTIAGTRYQQVARIDLTSGQPDPAWNPNVTGSVRTLSADAGGVFIGGNVTRVNGQTVTRVAKLERTDGSHIPGFAVTIDHSDGWENVLALTMHTSGDLMVGGTFDSVNGVDRASVARVDATSGAVRAFDPVLTDTNPNDTKVQIEDIVEHDGLIYLCGDWWETEGVGGQADQRNVGRFDPTSGAADQAWMPSVNRGLQACDIDPGGTQLIVAGDHATVNGQSVGAVQGIRLGDGTVDMGWLPDPATTVGVKHIGITGTGVVLVGDMTTASGASVGNAARYTLG